MSESVYMYAPDPKELDQYIERIKRALAEFPTELIAGRLHDNGRHCFVGFLSVFATQRLGLRRSPKEYNLADTGEFMHVERIYDAGLRSDWIINDSGGGYFETDTARAKRMKALLRRKLRGLEKQRAQLERGA